MARVKAKWQKCGVSRIAMNKIATECKGEWFGGEGNLIIWGFACWNAARLFQVRINKAMPKADAVIFA
jgi:hypothetical protein